MQEWIAARAGSEQVFEAIAQQQPHADLYALSLEPGVEVETGGRVIQTTRLDTSVLRRRRHLTLPLMPLAWRALGQRDYELVITSHHAFASSNRLTMRAGVHLAYVHTPARYVWTPELDGRGQGALLGPARSVLRRLDRAASRRLTGVAANSRTVAERVNQFWGLSARVIHPPVDVDYFAAVPETSLLDLPAVFLLSMGRWIQYKNHDMVLAVGERLGLPVVIAGRGPLGRELRATASRVDVPVQFFESPTREEVRELLQRAAVLVFPTLEDFGIVPVEAMAAGTPVVALGRGGATETVEHDVSGVLVDEHDVRSYASAVERALQLDPAACRSRSTRFSRERFDGEMLSWVEDELASR